ncbi:TPM domain-containing protein [Sphingomonas sp. CJ99]
MIRQLLFLWLLALAMPATAQDFPKRTTQPVVDAANIIPDDQEAALAAELDRFEEEKGQQFVVATIPDLQGYSIEDYGYRLGREWGIGREEVNDGVILIVAPNERKVRIEVGYGLTPVLTAGLSGAIIGDVITPRFKDGDLPGGIRAGADAILEQLRLPAPQAEARAKRILGDRAEKKKRKAGIFGLVMLVFWLMVIALIVVPLIFGRAKGKKYRGRRRGGAGPVIIWGPGWGGGSGGSSWGGGGGGGGGGWGGGGGFSGGGGSFGGGGASGGW